MNERDEREEKLIDHLRRMHECNPDLSLNEDATQAKVILADPQAHVDALVAAGVLAEIGMAGHPDQRYRVVQPVAHIHDWRVLGGCRWIGQQKQFAIGCSGCEETFWTDPIDSDARELLPQYEGEVPA